MSANPKAFPCDSRESQEFSGMTLRDYFAAKAMQATLSDSENLEAIARQIDSQNSAPDVVARMSYLFADAMLKARAA